ncbi:hypothetical protein [Campylobacter sp.]|jgi:hypothetical protein|uniref:hypothetical protein n=1 Tax=Campylobacter sp. TaxID=205 RepID=UPI0027B8A0EE|nr:hypothetical protein [Campylobacter sp.]
MIKKIFAAVLLACVMGLLISSMDIGESKISVRHGNTDKKPLQIEFGKYLCHESGTVINDLYNTAQAVMPNGDTYFFNDIANVFMWLMRQKNRDEIVVWVYSQDTEKYIIAKDAWYSRVEITPMGYGFGAYEFHNYGRSDYYYDEIVLCAARGETLLNPLINILLSENKI